MNEQELVKAIKIQEDYRMDLSVAYNKYTNLLVAASDDVISFHEYNEILKGYEGQTQQNKNRIRELKNMLKVIRDGSNN